MTGFETKMQNASPSPESISETTNSTPNENIPEPVELNTLTQSVSASETLEASEPKPAESFVITVIIANMPTNSQYCPRNAPFALSLIEALLAITGKRLPSKKSISNSLYTISNEISSSTRIFLKKTALGRNIS